MKRACILILFLCRIGLCNAQDTVKSVFTKYYTVNQLKSDFVFFRTALEVIHPSLYRYHPKDSVDSYFNQSFAGLNHPMNELEYWKILAKIIGKIGSGHTSLYLSDAARRQYAITTHNFLPADFYLQNGHLFIRNRFRQTDTALKKGAEVLAINNIPGPEIVKQMRSYVSGDGYNNAFKDRRIAVDFNHMYNLLNGDDFQYFFVLSDRGKVQHTLVKAARIFISSHGATGPNIDPNIKFPEDMPGTAVITIPNFEYLKEYERLHASFFKEIKDRKIANLIIDLRNNPGGQIPIINDLMGYVMTKNYQIGLSDENYVESGRIEYLGKKSQNNELSVSDIENVGHSLHQNQFKVNQLQFIRTRAFKGNLYLLVNEGSFSAAVMFSTAVKNQRDCFIVGQETGNSGYGSDAGVKTITLPETHIKLNLPVTWYFLAGHDKKNTGQGLIPDVLIPAPITPSFNFKDDAVMDAVKAHIKNTANKAN
ncbi:S41 family peptidase [Mucilaginibacter ximonensis]|uniref:S41 family peptidase n=2 Tax=Mucilaginibacter ximonensis TaxID=538021 RepID=A0ABW5YC57_9SPHI